MEQKVFQKGEVIFHENDVELCLYDISAGKVGIYADYGTEIEKLLTELNVGDFFGEMGLIDEMPRSATAVALEDNTTVNSISDEDFQGYLRSNPEKMLRIMQNMSSRIRALTIDYLEVCYAVSKAAAADKGGWFKEHMKKYIDDYASFYDRYYVEL